MVSFMMETIVVPASVAVVVAVAAFAVVPPAVDAVVAVPAPVVVFFHCGDPKLLARQSRFHSRRTPGRGKTRPRSATAVYTD